MRPRAPALYRISRALRIAATLALVLILLFVGLAFYSAAQVRPKFDPHSSTGFVLASNGTAHLTATLNLSNPGFFAIAPISVALQLHYPDGSLLALGGSPTVEVAPGATGVVPVSLWVPLSSATATLLTQDQNLTAHLWANLTYATLFHLQLTALNNLSWGAPFEGFSATPGTPQPQSNGTVLVPVQITFRNDASFDVVGTLTVTIADAQGAACSTTPVTIDTLKGSSFGQTLSFYLSGGCNPSGGTIVATYSGNGLTYAFPPEAIP